MATLWQFFGFPDPEGNTNKMPQPPQETVIEAESVESEVASLEEITDAHHSGTSAIPRGWTGPLTPDGEPFHDMDAYTPRQWALKSERPFVMFDRIRCIACRFRGCIREFSKVIL